MAFRGRGPRFVPPPQEQHRINRKIRCPEVRLIDVDGGQLGVVTTDEAMRIAENAGLDLVEVAPLAKPPVCRILDYGKFKYQQHKKEAESKRKQATTTLKELRLGYKTDVGDLERQIAKARAFLDNGDRVKFTLRFRGRELAYQNLGREKLVKICAALGDIASVEGSPKMEGRLMGVVLAPGVKKKKPTIIRRESTGDAPAAPAEAKVEAPSEAKAEATAEDKAEA